MKSFFIALQFLSRLHVVKQTIWTDEDFGRSVLYFPLVGLVIGLVLCALQAVFFALFSQPYAAVLVTASWLFITGGLHADGLIDTADGIFSGRSRERMLEILKDSRVGANGVMAFFFVMALKITFLANIGAGFLPAVLLAVPAAARFAVLIGIFEFPYAREQGLGKAFADYAPPQALGKAFIPAVLPALYCHAVHFFFLGAAILFSLWFYLALSRRLGGLTGDTYGACIECCETALLGLAVLLAKAVQAAPFSL